MQTCVITGTSGYVGNYLAEKFCEEYSIVKLDRTHGVDLTDFVSVGSIIEESKPVVIIHCAVYKGLRKCEENKEEAYKVNVLATGNLAQISKSIGAKFIYFSTDYVFDGERGLYTEEDLPNPINYFGKTKLDAENVVREVGGNYAILRTSGVYGSPNGSNTNMDTWALEKLSRGEQIKAFADIHNSPTYVDDLCLGVKKVLEEDVSGTFHLAGSERINRYDFLRKMADIFGYDQNLIIPELSSSVETDFNRPLDTSLVSFRLSDKLNIQLSGMERGMESFTSECIRIL